MIAGLAILGHLSQLPIVVRDFLDSLTMLYLLLITVPVFQLRSYLIQQLIGYYGLRYWVVVFRVITLALPISQAAMSIIGLAGYLHLASLMGWYIIQFIGVLIATVICQGLLNDAAAWLKHHAFQRSTKDWSALREAVNSAHRVFTILLLFGATIVLARMYGAGDRDLTDAWKVLVLTVAGVIAIYEALYLTVGYLTQRGGSLLSNTLVRRARMPLSLIIPITAAALVLPNLNFPREIIDPGTHVLLVAEFAAVTWLLMRLVSMLDNLAEARYGIKLESSTGARRAQTQIRVLRQALHATVLIIGVAAILMTFPTIRQFGAGLLASAGAAGIVLGIAARPLFENLIAGIQIGLTQPIRIGDVVIVEGEWGRIEEIAATYVVMRVWDKRRLVLPLKYFNETPFENWTRSSSELLGTVFLHTDYTFPVEEGRKALKRILEQSDLWDGKEWSLLVTDAAENTLELRAVMSAADAGKAWSLRCHVREKLVEYIQENHPEALPKTRALLASEEAENGRQPMPRVLLGQARQNLA